MITKQDILIQAIDNIKNQKYDRAISDIEEVQERISNEEQEPKRKLPFYHPKLIERATLKSWVESALYRCNEALEELEAIYKNPDRYLFYQQLVQCWGCLTHALEKMGKEEDESNNRE